MSFSTLISSIYNNGFLDGGGNTMVASSTTTTNTMVPSFYEKKTEFYLVNLDTSKDIIDHSCPGRAKY
jgi:hypothetical protein